MQQGTRKKKPQALWFFIWNSLQSDLKWQQMDQLLPGSREWKEWKGGITQGTRKLGVPYVDFGVGFVDTYLCQVYQIAHFIY